MLAIRATSRANLKVLMSVTKLTMSSIKLKRSLNLSRRHHLIDRWIKVLLNPVKWMSSADRTLFNRTRPFSTNAMSTPGSTTLSTLAFVQDPSLRRTKQYFAPLNRSNWPRFISIDSIQIYVVNEIKALVAFMQILPIALECTCQMHSMKTTKELTHRLTLTRTRFIPFYSSCFYNQIIHKQIVFGKGHELRLVWQGNRRSIICSLCSVIIVLSKRKELGQVHFSVDCTSWVRYQELIIWRQAEEW